MKRAPLLAFLVLGVACRAAPIPESRWYPAGTSLQPKYVTVLGTRIRYVEMGTGPTVVLLHGLCASIYTWRDVIGPVSAAGFHVVAFDNRGFGGSDRPTSGYSEADYASLTVALLDSLHLTDVVLVGHSMGGEIAALATLRDPGNVRGLVLIDAAGLGTHMPLLTRLARAPLVGRLVAGLRGRDGVEEALRSTFGVPSRVTQDEVDQYYAPVAAPDFGRTLAGVAHQFDFSALKGRLDSIAKPTLVMWGSRDVWIPPGVGEQMTASLPRAAFVLVPGVGHDLPDEDPAALLRSLIPFLQQGIPQPPPNVAILRIDINPQVDKLWL
ncbi:MAG TPA: alpha/beta hydrolase [Gemmatimonadales bacterium]|nr:alpha/beta hydrolase [Gemmatimonadales bacterium]